MSATGMPSLPCFKMNAFWASENREAFIVLRSSQCSETQRWIAGGWSFPAFSRWRAGCAIVIQQRNRCSLADCTVWALLIVVLAPILQFFPGICKVQEPVSIQTFGSEATV